MPPQDTVNTYDRDTMDLYKLFMRPTKQETIITVPGNVILFGIFDVISFAVF